MMKKNIEFIDILAVSIITVTVFLLPVFFLTNTTDLFTIPKQLLIIFSTLSLFVIWGVKAVLERRVVINVNPLNLPLAIFTGIILVSAILSMNRYDSLIQAVPVAAAVLFAFAIVNFVRQRKYFSVILSSLVLGGAVSAVITILYHFKIFLPFVNIQSEFFNPLGSSIQQLIFTVPLLIFSLIFIARKTGFPKIKISSGLSNDYGFFINLVSAAAMIGGIAVIAFQIIASPNKPILLPYIYGFQTAAATITQDAQRFILSLLLGSGYGTFAVDFTRFRLPAFNLEQNIWNLTFSFSSSYFLELIATTGLLGAISYVGVIISIIRTRIMSNPLFIALALLLVFSFILPFGFAAVALLMILSGMYVSFLNIAGDKRVYDTAMSLLAAKSGGFSLETVPQDHHSKRESPVFPALVLLLILLFVGFVGFYSFRFLISDLKFAESLRLANTDAQRTYQLETEAIRDFPYRADYHRIFSQVNLALANSLAQDIQPGASPSAEVQQSIVTLLQQSINSARNAVILAPFTSLNWQNLSQIYRSLINVGENAEQFAIASMDQAIALDPYNPVLYIQRGGIFYQLGQFDAAQQQFQIAINLKRDFANAYYNLGHVLKEKGDLRGALAAYQTVRQLSAGNQANLDTINPEIAALEAKIGETPPAAAVEPETDQAPLLISTPSAQLPPQRPPIKISPPPHNEPAQSAE
jgi:tetratricopeptide (TPR) repeat protein